MYERVGFFAAPLEVRDVSSCISRPIRVKNPSCAILGRIRDSKWKRKSPKYGITPKFSRIRARVFVCDHSFRLESALVRGEKSTDVEPSRNVFVCAIVPTCIEILTGGSPVREALRATCPRWKEAPMSGGLQIQPDDELKFRRAFAAPRARHPPSRDLSGQKHAMLTPSLPFIPPTAQSSSRSRSPRRSGCTTVATRKSLQGEDHGPKKYCVKPNTGFVKKGETVNVHVIMQAQREARGHDEVQGQVPGAVVPQRRQHGVHRALR